MTRPKILVTGATGKTGAIVVLELLKADYPVRAMVRAEDGRSQKLKAAGAEIAVADMCDAEQVAAGLNGVQRAYYVPPFDPNMLNGAVVFATAAKEARLESIVGLSQWLASPSHPSMMTRHHWLADRLFSMIPGTAHTIINPGMFADMPYLSLIGYAAQLGILPSIFGASRNAPPSVDDIARVSAAALMDPERHGGKTYRPTGPELIGANDMARILGQVLNRSVMAMPMPIWMFMRAARLDDFAIALLSNFRYYIEDHKRGAFELGAPTDDVLEVTGRRPESFETVARRHAALPRATRTVANFAKQFAKFMAVPLAPPFDLSKYDDELRGIPPATPQFAQESPAWRRERGLGDITSAALAKGDALNGSRPRATAVVPA